MKHPAHRLTALIALCLALASPAAWSQARTVTVIVPFGPGGNFDLNARLLANLVKPYMSEPWVVVNRPGINGAIGIGEMMKSRPDGKTVTLAGGSLLLTGFTADVPWKNMADFEQVAVVLASYSVHYVRADAPWKTMTELVEYSKKNPGVVNFGATGPFSVSTLRHLMLRQLTSMSWTEVPFKGDADVMNALLGGHVQTASGGIAGVMPNARAGRVRILAVPAEERVPTMPNVPTLKELGYPVVLPSLNIILAPRTTPADALQPMVSAIERATKLPEYAKFAEDSGAVLYTRFGEAMKSVMSEQEATFRKVAPLLKEYMRTNPGG